MSSNPTNVLVARMTQVKGYRPHAQPSPATLKAVVLTFQSVAILTTLYRLVLRYRGHGLWWDDFWAFIALVSDMITVISLMVFVNSGADSHVGATTFRIGVISFISALWLARVSLSFVIIRISPPGSSMRRSALAMAGLFGAMGLALLLQRIVYCAENRHWTLSCFSHPICKPGLGISIASVCTDLLADVLLVLVPVRALWRCKLDPRYRRIVLLVFTASLLTTLASFPQAATQTWIGGPFAQLASQVEVSISLTVCNLLILVSHVYRIFRTDEDLESCYDYISGRPMITFPCSNLHTTVGESVSGSTLTSVHYSVDERPSPGAVSPDPEKSDLFAERSSS